MTTTLTLSYYPWITQSISGAELHKAVSDFVALLQEGLRVELGEKDANIKLLSALKVPDQLDELEAKPTGDVKGKIGLLNPFGFSYLYERSNKKVTTIAVIRRMMPFNKKVGTTYSAQLYANKNTAIRKVEQLRGKSMAFGSAQSTSNFLVPFDKLLKAGIHPLAGFARVEFSGGHDKAALAVYEGRVDAGAGHDGVILDLASKNGYSDADSVLVRLDDGWSDPIPSDPVGANIEDDGLRNAVIKALQAVAGPIDASVPKDKVPPGNLAVKRFWGTEYGFDKIDPSAYQYLVEIPKKIGLTAADILKKK